MAIVFTYDVCRMDGTAHATFKNSKKAEAYAMSIKNSPDELIQITRSAKNFATYVYYV